MFAFKLVTATIFFVTVHGTARFTDSQFNTIALGRTFNITWTGNNNVSLELRNGAQDNLILVEVIAPEIIGYFYPWTPNGSLPVSQNALKIIDNNDLEPNYSPQFNISGANATWVSNQNPLLDGSEPGGTNPGGSTTPGSGSGSSSGSGGLSGTAKIALGVAVPVGAIVVGICIWACLRNKRDSARRAKYPLRTMSTDNTPTRYKSEYSTPGKPELHSDSSTRFAAIKKFLVSEKEVDTTPKQASPTSWDDEFPTPPNNRSTASPPGGEDEIHASVEGRYRSNYNRLQHEPESPTPKQRSVSAPVRQAVVPNQHWELSAGTPTQPRAELAQPQVSHELPHNQRNVSSPLPASSSSSRQPERNDGERDIYKEITFGDSEDPDEIVANLTAKRLKVRAEKERLRKLQELATAEEDLERQIEEARQKRG